MSRLEKGSMEKVRQYCTGNGVPSLPLPHWTMSLTKGEVRARRFVFLRRQAYTDIACLTKRITSFDTFSFLLLFFFFPEFIFPWRKNSFDSARVPEEKNISSRSKFDRILISFGISQMNIQFGRFKYSN